MFASSAGDVMPESTAVFSKMADFSLKLGMSGFLDARYLTMVLFFFKASCKSLGLNADIEIHPKSFG